MNVDRPRQILQLVSHPRRVPTPTHPSMWLRSDPEKVQLLRTLTTLPITDLPERSRNSDLSPTAA